MPGIFGAVSRVPNHTPSSVTEIMQQNMLHEPWYGSVLESLGQQVFGALSTNPFFSGKNHLARRPEALLLVEGTALTIDNEHVPDAAPDLAERLLAVYLESGEDFALRIGGHFNLVVADQRDGKLHLVNDRNGFAQLYYYLDDDVFLFAPELKAFLAWQGMDRTLNEGSFGAMLANECPFGTETLFSSVQMLAPASHVTFDGRGVTVRRYWRPEPGPVENRTTDDWLDEAEHLYDRSMEKRLPSSWDGRVILPLSGGLDSRLLLWLAQNHGERLDMFTHGQHDCTDAVLAGQVAETMGLESGHRLIKMNPDWMGENARKAVWLNDGQLNLRNATLVGISRELDPGPVPFLNGIIGAHMSLGVGGFINDDEVVHISDEDQLRKKVLAYSKVESGSSSLMEMMPEEKALKMKQLACQQVWRSFDDVRHIELFGDQKALHLNYNMGRRMQGTVDVHRFFFHDLLPFVDEELHDFWLRIPLELRRGNKLYKELYRRRMEKLARVPWSYTGLDLFATKAENSAGVAMRMKRLRRQATIRKYSFGLINPRNSDAYNHRETWLRKNRKFRTLMSGVLGNIEETGCDWFDQNKINSLFKRFDQGRDYLFRPLMQVATVALWHELFLREELPSAGLRPEE